MLAHVRDVSGCDPTYGASAVPARGLANCSRAALGIDPAGMTTGLPGVWLSLAVERVQRPLRPAGNDPPKSEARPEAEWWRSRLNESRGGAPKGERIPLDAQPHPYDAAKGRLRLSALRLPSFPGGLFDMVDKTKWMKLARKARRENDDSYPPPR